MLGRGQDNCTKRCKQSFQHCSQVQIKNIMYLCLWLIIVNFCIASSCTERCIFAELMFIFKSACIEYVLRTPKTNEAG